MKLKQEVTVPISYASELYVYGIKEKVAALITPSMPPQC